MRGWSDGEVKVGEPVFGRGTFACGPNGFRARVGSRLAMGFDRLDCGKDRLTAETLRGWVRQTERDQGRRSGPNTDERERIKVLERGNRELRQVDEILRKASAYFAMAELDRRSKP